jgi:hypothetical protein
LALAVPGLFQTVSKRGGIFGIRAWRRCTEKSNHRHRRLLRSRHHRPSSRTSKPCDELPASHPSVPSLLSESLARSRLQGNGITPRSSAACRLLARLGHRDFLSGCAVLGLKLLSPWIASTAAVDPDPDMAGLFCRDAQECQSCGDAGSSTAGRCGSNIFACDARSAGGQTVNPTGLLGGHPKSARAHDPTKPHCAC